MRALIERIRANGRIIGDGLLGVDGFLNHQLDPELLAAIGGEFAARFAGSEVTKVVTAEISGIAPALMTARALGVTMVFARKRRPATLTGDCYRATARSRTKGDEIELIIAADYLAPGERVLIVDDFLATGATSKALATMVANSGASLVGVGCVIEKPVEGGRGALGGLAVPVVSLARVTFTDGAIAVVG
ncbi:MAG: xanthine phosphoribosyltransferase [Candidatus Competibacterales bacterium]